MSNISEALKVTDLLKDLAEIHATLLKTGANIHGIAMNNDKGPFKAPVRVHMSNESFANFKIACNLKPEMEDYTEEYNKAGIVLFDRVEVFCLIEKTQPMVDINVVSPEEEEVKEAV